MSELETLRLAATSSNLLTGAVGAAGGLLLARLIPALLGGGAGRGASRSGAAAGVAVAVGVAAAALLRSPLPLLAAAGIVVLGLAGASVDATISRLLALLSAQDGRRERLLAGLGGVLLAVSVYDGAAELVAPVVVLLATVPLADAGEGGASRSKAATRRNRVDAAAVALTAVGVLLTMPAAALALIACGALLVLAAWSLLRGGPVTAASPHLVTGLLLLAAAGGLGRVASALAVLGCAGVLVLASRHTLTGWVLLPLHAAAVVVAWKVVGQRDDAWEALAILAATVVVAALVVHRGPQRFRRSDGRGAGRGTGGRRSASTR